MHSKKLELFAGSLLVIGATALPAAAVFADSSNAVCGYPPGRVISHATHTPGPNAGPRSANQWNTAPSAPNAPGQAINNVCH